MSRYQWRKEYETGIPELDAQNAQIVDMMNQLDDSLRSGKGIVNEEVGKVLTQLVTYTKTHFADEERIMIEIGFSHHDAHRKAHKDMTKKLYSMLLRLKRGNTINVMELIAFLQFWLIDHIIKEDLRIGLRWRNFCANEPRSTAAAQADHR